VVKRSAKKLIFRLLPVISVSLLLVACSTEKDGFVYRAYHNTTAHFNGHFNANESVKKGVAKIEAAHKEDYDELLPLFIYGTEETASAAYPEMEKAIEKSSRVIDRHTIKASAKKERKHPVLNKWIDENYMLIGIGHFYKKNFFKAEELFNYVYRKYDEQDVQLEALTWLARSYAERKEYGKVNATLNKAEITNKTDAALKAEYYMVWADSYIRQEEYKKAAEKLEEALRSIEKKRDLARPHFVLAQLYQRLNESTNALTHYEAVINSRAPYEMEFYARISKATAFSRTSGSSDQIRKELMKLLNDDKNLSYRDQIYYALAELELEEQHREEGIDYLKKSLEATENNQKQKAKAFLRLADLYFEEREYENAQTYYDSTYTNITDTHKRYKEIKARAQSLTELIGYLNTIAENDSLIKLCALEPAALEKALRKAQKKIEEEIAERERKEAEALEAANDAAAGDDGPQGTFWAYNTNLKKKGYENFVDYWGDRPLEDDWRRSRKTATAFTSEEEVFEEVSEQPEEKETDEVPTIDELREGLPCGDEASLADMNNSTAEAHYNAGVLYKEKLDDNENAINIWQDLLALMDDSDFHPTTYYQLFRTYLNREQEEAYSNPFCKTCNSQYWGNQIKQRYPGTEWARLVDNPEYLDYKELKESEESAAYELVYRSYADRNYPGVILECTRVIDTQPDNHLLCKYRLLRAVCVGFSDAVYAVKENYQRELNEVASQCGDAEEGARARELLAAFSAGQSNTYREEPKIDESTAKETEAAKDSAAVQSPYTFNESMEHYVALVFTVKDNDVNKVKADVADFNLTNYNSLALKVTNNLFDKEHHIVLVKTFKTIPEGTDYLNTMRGDTQSLQSFKASDFTTFLISKLNYITFFKQKNIDQYLEWYYLNYNE
jgi:tetratricopeptide (TPR) repeat protein